jgi:hypothetical protein
LVGHVFGMAIRDDATHIHHDQPIGERQDNVEMVLNDDDGEANPVFEVSQECHKFKRLVVG